VFITLLAAGAEVNAGDDQKETALMLAAKNRQNPAVITMLLRAGADVKAVDEEGMTPLMQAIFYNENPEVITVLLKAGADAGVKDRSGKSAFEYARDNAKLKTQMPLSYSKRCMHGRLVSISC